MSKLDSINKARKELGLRPLSNLYCRICKKDDHSTKTCPERKCAICAAKHDTRTCPKRPKICQYCNQDLNKNNYGTGKAPPHSDFFDCPKKKMLIAKRFVRCLFCKKIGHIAMNCRSRKQNINKFGNQNYNQFKKNYYNRSQNNKKGKKN